MGIIRKKNSAESATTIIAVVATTAFLVRRTADAFAPPSLSLPSSSSSRQPRGVEHKGNGGSCQYHGHVPRRALAATNIDEDSNFEPPAEGFGGFAAAFAAARHPHRPLPPFEPHGYAEPEPCYDDITADDPEPAFDMFAPRAPAPYGGDEFDGSSSFEEPEDIEMAVEEAFFRENVRPPPQEQPQFDREEERDMFAPRAPAPYVGDGFDGSSEMAGEEAFFRENVRPPPQEQPQPQFDREEERSSFSTQFGSSKFGREVGFDVKGYDPSGPDVARSPNAADDRRQVSNTYSDVGNDPFPKHGTGCHNFEPTFSGRAGGGQVSDGKGEYYGGGSGGGESKQSSDSSGFKQVEDSPRVSKSYVSRPDKDPFPKHGTGCQNFEPTFSGRAGGGQVSDGAGAYYGGGVSSLDGAFQSGNVGAGFREIEEATKKANSNKATTNRGTKDPFPKHGTGCHNFEPTFSGRAGGGQVSDGAGGGFHP